jgi:cell division protein FtsW (lipid II flippase)/cell division protein FtsI/penicillin-binding protein 2
VAVTVSTVADRTARTRVSFRARALDVEAVALAGVAAVIVIAALVVYGAKTSPDARPALGWPPAVNLNRLDSARIASLAASLRFIPSPAEREFTAREIARFAADERQSLPNVGALARVRVPVARIDENPALDRLRTRAADARARPDASAAPDLTVPLLSSADLRDLKPLVLVREAAVFRRSFFTSLAMLLGAFGLAHAARRAMSGSGGDGVLLPLVGLLCGAGFVTMTSIPDPLRDRLLFKPFAEGVAAGCVVLVALNALDFQRSPIRRFSYVPLLAALALSALLVVFGSGPGVSGAKVNLLGVQPVEAIRLLVVLFLAGYLARRWELLRELKEDVRDAPVVRWFDVPRLDYVLPLLAGMALVLGFFFLQRDLGPALVLGTLFLALYAVARRRVVLVLAGFGLLVGGVTAGYALGIPATVAHRIDMWRSPFENAVRGGDQLAQSLWAFAAGGTWGMSPGRGSPDVIPAAHTDLVLAAFGEEWGLAGVAVLFAVYAAITVRALRIARRAPGDYTMFLALGLTLSLVLQVLLIAGGALGLLPLSGVVTPFLSYGRSSMLANFAAVGMLLAIADRGGDATAERAAFARPVRWLAVALALAGAAVLTKVTLVQTVRADAMVAAPALGLQADGARRYQYNPRLVALANTLTRGTVFDRNGVPLATSRTEVIEKHRRQLGSLGAELAARCADPARRCYPFGGLTFHLLGDRESGINWAASNTSFQERDSDDRLRGFDDHARVVALTNADGTTARVVRRSYQDLVPLLRSREGVDSDSPAVRRILERPRDVRMTIDVRLQTRVAAVLRRRMEAAHHERAAVVVLDPASGDLLAAVSYPWPSAPASSAEDVRQDEEDDALFDRARYGMYPPGSTFKLVTAAAALRHSSSDATFACARLPDGRVGQRVGGRIVRDDPTDTVPHGTLDMQRALVVSCNAYFAQLGLRIGAAALHDTAQAFGIAASSPDTVEQLRRSLADAAYGQGQVLITPFKMARVAATIAAGGLMPTGRWTLDAGSGDTPTRVLDAADARRLAQAMRIVVTSGTGRALADAAVPVAGKTGTAEMEGRPSHSWFAGFAPYGSGKASGSIAFAVIVENGGYGARAAAPIAGDVVAIARQLGIIGAADPPRGDRP